MKQDKHQVGWLRLIFRWCLVASITIIVFLLFEVSIAVAIFSKPRSTPITNLMLPVSFFIQVLPQNFTSKMYVVIPYEESYPLT